MGVPPPRRKWRYAVAQLVEALHNKEKVADSFPFGIIGAH